MIGGTKQRRNFYTNRMEAFKLGSTRVKNTKIYTFILVLVVLVGSLSFQYVFSAFINSVSIASTGRISGADISPLHVEGRYIKDQSGNIVNLRGVFKAEFADTCTGWFPRLGEPTYDGYNYFYEEGVHAMCQALRDTWGANVIHTYTWAKWWIDDATRTISSYQPGTDYSLRYCLRRFAEIAGEYGIYISFRFYGIIPGIEGGDDRVNMPYPELPEYPGSHYLGSHDGSVIVHRDDFVALWGDIASEFADLPNVIFYLYDEPICYSSEWIETTGMAVNAIRAAEAASGYGVQHLVASMLGYCGAVTWALEYRDASILNPTEYPLENVVFSSHIYRFHGTYDEIPDSSVDLDYIRQKLTLSPTEITNGRHYKEVSETVPLFVSAMGTWWGETDNNEYTYFQNTLTVLNELQIGYSAYQWLRTQLPWAIQYNTDAIQPPNRIGQTLIDAIEAGKS